MTAETIADPTYGPAELPPEIIDPATGEPVRTKRKYTRRDPGSPARPRGRPRKKPSLESDIGGMLVMFNFIFGFMPQPWKDDAFTEEEIIALSRALDAYAQDHATIYKYLSTVLIGGGTSTIQLFLVVGQITQRRLENHNVDVFKLLGIKNGATDGDLQPLATE